MKRLIILSIALVSLCGCRFDDQSGEPVSSYSLWNYAKAIFADTVTYPVDFVKDLRAVDAYEALPEEEKKLPVYSPFRDGTKYEKGRTYYKNIGWISHDGKRFIEKGATWGQGSYTFTCVSEAPLAWEYSCSYFKEKGNTFLITVQENGYSVDVEYHDRGENGFSAIARSEAPFIYDDESSQFTGDMQVDIFDKSGQQVDWVKFNIKAGQIYCRTSRD